MGVPAFYKWLVNKYPNVITSPNPNGLEFDNLYLDMNGIIHPCFHPDDHPSPPTTFDEVFNNIYKYIDHIFSIVRPRNLLYLAIDGVAPRAKMNQQRSRRFRNAKDTEIAEAEEERLRKEYEIQGKQVLPKQYSEVSDSNIITPGTEFMFTLSIKLQEYMISNINSDPAWKAIKVILSDASVPGEGEHKIMSFIRQQRMLPDYNPNTRHCLYGLDADLIMLALASHEVHFSILREVVLLQQPQSICLSAHTSLQGRIEFGEFGSSENKTKRRFSNDDNTLAKDVSFIEKPYQFLHVWILRDYLKLEMDIYDPPENFTFDSERIIDDFVFMCFFAGNDFIPNLPTLQIHERAVDLLMTVYKKNFKKLGGYLVDVHQVNSLKNDYLDLKRVEKFILLIGAYEEMIFKKRSELRERMLRKLCQHSDAANAKELDGNVEQDMLKISFSSLDAKAQISEDLVSVSAVSISLWFSVLQNTKRFKEELKARLRQKSDLFQNGGFRADTVKLGTTGWKKRYYEQKFSAENPSDIELIRKEMVQKYTEGLLWVLGYYFSAVPSWTWFYPYHHAPFASDMKGMAQVKFKFPKGSPFKPFDQLMGVLPPRSAHALPKSYRQLMIDERSSIIDFYPAEFQIDIDGKRFMWQGICKLPFIDEERLLAETKKMEKELTRKEADKNVENVDKLFVRRENFSESQLLQLVSEFAAGRPKDMVEIKNSLRCLLFELPKGSQFIPRPLEGVKYPEQIIGDDDIMETQLWHECPGSRCPTRLRVQESHIKSYHRRDFAPSFSAERNNGNYSGESASNWYFEPTHKGGRGRGRGRERGVGSLNYYQLSNYCRKSELSSSSEQIHKGAGPANTGWGACRGRGRGRGITTVDLREHIEKIQRVEPFASSSVVGGSGRGHQNFNRTMFVELAKGMEDGLKLSEGSQSISPHGKSVSANNSFWRSRNGMPYQKQTNNACRQSLQFNADSWIEVDGRGKLSSMMSSDSRPAPGIARENH
ncbi:5'-_3' exoribonuclease, putative [Ricinus communis]|uniref:5'->3' exoribonuclease, putative n=1 Tax=Ricinus communis TaxID=3988 RepID=B9SD01_RICCO|nr:5'->3' exoribonuclease, putative [Ricinus communis]